MVYRKLEEAGLSHNFSPGETMTTLTDEFTERLTNSEKKLQVVSRERDQLRAQLSKVSAATAANDNALR